MLVPTLSQSIATVIVGFLIAVLHIPTPVQAETQAVSQVTFPSAIIPLTPFRVTRVKEFGMSLAPKPTINLNATLFTPETNSPRPAVIILVGDDGLQQSHLNWGATLADWGYVSLVIDIFGSRGGKNFQDTLNIEMPEDTTSAVKYLRSLKSVDSDKIALLGFSLGGSRILSFFDRQSPSHIEDINFSAGVALYPNCAPGKQFSAPLLILAGISDQMMTFNLCKRLSNEADVMNNDVSAHFYPGVTHFFDNPDYRKDTISKKVAAAPPLWFQTNHYSEAAHKDALARVKSFLKARLGS